MSAIQAERPDAPATQNESFLRFLTCGSVDDGKSTLIGRLLYECQVIYEDQFATLERDSQRFGTTGDDIDFALLVDGLDDERQQGITIDVAYRFFKTPRRAFIVADTPGHVQYTRNMATGASMSDVAVILIDARKGVLPQTKRHATICSLLGIRNVIVAVNKIDLVDYDEETFRRIVADFETFARSLDFASILPIPLSARHGDNVIGPSEKMPWYDGPSLISALETVDVEQHRSTRPFRFSVQLVMRPNLDFRGFAGTIASGRVRVGDPIVVAASGRTSSVARIVTADGDLPEAVAGDAVTLVLADEIDAARGDIICSPTERPIVADQFAAEIVWMSDEPLLPGRQYLLRMANRTVPASVTAIKYKHDIEEQEKLAAAKLDLNEIGFCNLSTSSPVAFDPYKEDPETGSFILIDRYTHATAAAGMVSFALNRAANIHMQKLTVDKAARGRLLRQQPAVLWFTGLSGSGKSTIADLVERKLHGDGYLTYTLDGDNIRHGLSRDLGFAAADRVENIRRIGEVAKLFVDAGLLVMCSFVSPFAAERQMVRELLADGEFIEVFVDTPIEICMQRDPKGLYAKAQKGDLKNFTGIDSPYEAPEAPDLHLHTEGTSPYDLAGHVLALLKERGIVG
jgi:bifunctional enzyme CysN/CysC